MHIGRWLLVNVYHNDDMTKAHFYFKRFILRLWSFAGNIKIAKASDSPLPSVNQIGDFG